MLNLDPFISTVFLLFLISSHCEDDEVWKLIKRRAGPGCKDEILGLKFFVLRILCINGSSGLMYIRLVQQICVGQF